MTQRILLNSARCNNCNTRLVSKYLGDYRNCSCGQLGINGGPQQIIRHYTAGLAWTELSIMEDMHVESGSRGPARDRAPAEHADVPGDGDGGVGRSDVPRRRVTRGRPVEDAGQVQRDPSG